MKKLITGICMVLAFTGCKYAEVSTSYVSTDPEENPDQKGRALLEASVKAMGYDKFENLETYQADALFDWRFPWTITPMNALPGAKSDQVRMRFLPGTFDGQIEHLEGRKAGTVFGVQSWEYYEKKNEDFEMAKNARREWALPTYHYLIEGPYRLLTADIIRYAGTSEYNGITYDLIFVTWRKPEPHKEHDQWLLYVNQKTKMIDLLNATIRDYFLPMPRNMAEGTVLYKRKRHESGIYFPVEMTIQFKTPKKENRHIYKILMSNYQVNSFEPARLKPFDGLKEYGDSKPENLKD